MGYDAGFMGREDTGRIAALVRQVDDYVRRNEILKAAAVCKQILTIDPAHAETRRRILELRELHDRGSQPAPRRTQTKPPLPRDGSWMQNAGAIDRLPLAKVMSGTGRGQGVYEISLDDEVAEDAPLHLSLQAASAKSAPAVEEKSEDAAFLAVEEEFRAAEATNAALMNTAIFTDLSPKTFGELLMHAKLVELDAKKELFKQGDAGDALYVIAEGTIGVVDEGPPRRGITKLKDGDVFGEIALMTDEPRTATIVALTPTKLIEIDRAVVRKLIASDDQFLTILLRFFRDRSVARLLTTNPLFTGLSERDREALKTRFRFLELDAGAPLVQAGKTVPGLLILLSGRASVDRGGGKDHLADLGPGDLCGEISLLTKSPANADVRAVSKCIAIELPGAAFLKIVEARPEAKSFVERLLKERLSR
jgi:CRP-like cAMP-binding protein